MKKLLVCLLLVGLLGCATFTGQKMNSGLKMGMARDQVVSTLGNPDGVKRDGEYEVLSYYDRYVSRWSPDKADYYVVLKDNQVPEYGVDIVRLTQTVIGAFVLYKF